MQFGVALRALAASGVAAALPPLADWLAAAAGWARGAGALGVLALAAAYALAALLALPLSPLALVAGLLYGPLWGLAVAWPSTLGGATLAFLAGRYVFRAAAMRLASRWPPFAAVNEAVRENGLRLVFLIRLSPVLPGNLLNYAFGASRVRRRDFVGGTALGIVPVTALYAYLGSLATGVADLSSGRASDAGTAGRVLYWAGLLVTALAVLLVTRAARRVLARTLAGRTKGRAPGREPG
jgi:uncharacterized membrane protein YdjX (TVP38/TMEM64 family)